MTPTIDLPSANPDEFPETDADTVREWAAKLDYWVFEAGGQLSPWGAIVNETYEFVFDRWEDTVNALFDTVKKVLGDYTVARGLAIDWAESATAPADVNERLKDALHVVDARWEGAGFDAFAGHLGDVFDAIDKTEDKMVNIAETLATAITHVHDTWAAALKFITQCAADLTALVGMPLSAPEAFGLLGDLVENVGDLVADAISIMGGYKADITSLEINAITFPALPDNSKSAEVFGDAGEWDVAPKS